MRGKNVLTGGGGGGDSEEKGSEGKKSLVWSCLIKQGTCGFYSRKNKR